MGPGAQTRLGWAGPHSASLCGLMASGTALPHLSYNLDSHEFRKQPLSSAPGPSQPGRRGPDSEQACLGANPKPAVGNDAPSAPPTPRGLRQAARAVLARTLMCGGKRGPLGYMG